MPYIIAEIGINHEGKIKRAMKLIKNAKKAGADAVKFQLFEPETLAPNKKETKKKKLYQMWKKVSLNENDIKKLKEYSKKNRIDFFCSVFDKKSLKIINKLEIKYIKIASSDLNDDILLRKIAKTKKKVFLSTGMANELEIKNALNILKNNKIILMHCVSLYPCPLKLANLNRINTLKEKFKKMIGYSDHCSGVSAAITSINMGVQAIEKHFTDNKYRKGFDHALSADYKDLKEIVEYAKEFKNIKGSGKINPSKKEIKMRNFARKSIYYKKKFSKGHVLNKDDLIIRRPLAILEPKNLNKILKKRLRQNVLKHSAVKISHLN